MHVYRSMVQCEVVPCGVLYISRWCLVCCSVLCVRGLQYVAVRFGAVWCSLHITLVSCVLQCAVCRVGVLCVAVCCVHVFCSILQCGLEQCGALHVLCVAALFNTSSTLVLSVLQCVAVSCTLLQCAVCTCIAECCSVK